MEQDREPRGTASALQREGAAVATMSGVVKRLSVKRMNEYCNERICGTH